MTSEEIKALAARVKRAQRRIDELTAQRDQAIRDALHSGTATAADLAAAFDLSIPRIYQIRDQRR